ncbi:MAG: hypothetical protein Aureis2KO_18790 [Aureisphaera sp.]
MQKRNKVLTIIPSLYGGGAERFVADLTSSLCKEYDHTLVTYNRKSGMYSFEGELIELPVRESNSPISRFIRFHRLKRRLGKLKGEKVPSVSISHMLIPNLLNVLTRKEGKVICVIHGQWSIGLNSLPFLNVLFKKLYARADVIVSVSQFIQEKFVEAYPLGVSHEIIHAGVDIDRVLIQSQETIEQPLPEEYLVYVAGFREVKNHISLLHNLKDFLKSSNYSLVLVGEGPKRKEIEATISNLGLSDSVILLGGLLNPYPVVKGAKLSLMVSSSESFSLVVV